MCVGRGFQPHDAAVFADEIRDWDAGAVDHGLRIADDFRLGVDWSLALFTSDEEERAIELAGGLEVGEESLQAAICGVEGGFEARVGRPAGVEVAGGLLGPGYGLEVGADEAGGSVSVSGAVGPVAGGPILEGGPCELLALL